MTESERGMEKYKDLMVAYNMKIEQRLDVKDKDIDLMQVPHWNGLSYDEDDPSFMEEFGKVINNEGVPKADNQYGAQSANERDAYINMEIGLPHGGDNELIYAKVKGRALDSEEDPIGKESINPITNTRLYEVEFVDGTTETVPANVIAENLLLQVDQEGHRQLLLDKIISNRRLENAIPKSEGTFITSAGTTRKKQTMRRCELCVQWKEGSTNWVSLKDVKNSFLIELADYEVMASRMKPHSHSGYPILFSSKSPCFKK